MKLNLLLLSAAAMVSAANASHAPDHVDLGSAGDYVILAKSGISTVPSSAITGAIAVSPITAAAMTGFGLIMDSTGTFSTSSPQLTGNAYGSDYTNPTPSELTTAVLDMQRAYIDAASRPVSGLTYQDLKGGLIGGETLTPGVYNFGSYVLINGADVTFSGAGKFIIQVSGSVVQFAGVTLTNGAKAENIVWQVAGEVIVDTGKHMEGVLLCATAVKFNTGSSLNGRILAQTAVTLQSATIVEKP
jgi:hypothetical protein